MMATGSRSGTAGQSTISYAPPPNVTRTKEEAKARAEEALKKIKSGKVKFEDAAAPCPSPYVFTMR
jgi:hypothetical protein